MPEDAGIRTLADIPRFQARRAGDTALLGAPRGRMERTTYRDLDRATRGVRHMAEEAGLEPGDRTGLLMPNARRWIPAYFGLLQAGAVVVPLNYDHMEEEQDKLFHALSDAGARAVFAHPDDVEACRRIVPPCIETVVPVPHIDELAESPPAVRDAPVEPGDRAQILYTSGTTGPGKGVVLTHRNVVSNARMCCRRLHIYSTDRVPAFLPYHHAFPLTASVVLPLYAGARIAVGDFRSPAARRLLPRIRPTLLVGVPRVFESLLDAIRSSARREGRVGQLGRLKEISRGLNRWTGLNAGRLLLASLHRKLFGGLQLRFGVSGGARLRTEVFREYAAMGIPLLQGWGMTELSPVGAVQEFCPWTFYLTRRYERRAGSVGRPMPGTSVRLSEAFEGEAGARQRGVGEVVVNGPHVMEGYLDAPEETARRRTEHGLKSEDLAVRGERGDLYLVGRTQQVIVLPNGKKVFPDRDLHDEIASCPGVDEFTIMAVEQPGRGERIGLVIRPCLSACRDGGAETVGDVYRLIRGQIMDALADKPDYMRDLDFCLTPLADDEFAELSKNAAHEPCPSKNEFRPERCYRRMKDSETPLPE
ncbi:MAG: AMP-binding protein [Planctomycetota bacterium]